MNAMKAQYTKVKRRVSNPKRNTSLSFHTLKHIRDVLKIAASAGITDPRHLLYRSSSSGGGRNAGGGCCGNFVGGTDIIAGRRGILSILSIIAKQ